jgi:hypothetical protein
MREYVKILPALALAALAVGTACAADKPNILVLWGDDIGQSNISTYTHGLVGYKTLTSTASPMKA